ncbi:hypothetical protein HNY73_006879 [Argiope bruennichi]|uniref:Uncharacterized protein n=1 Tax=Argiope bruennichi TaxID=94029 RepID=A0A8T0FCP1_ARGBR|nr:hypothetical protein HNY73_006879 [Argiope bruennichi]
MSLASLYRICLDNICELIRAGIWTHPSPNPFSDLPVHLELIVQIPNLKDAPLKFLRFSGELTLLRIDFLDCKHDFMAHFIELLQDIGPQLKHLSVISHRPVPVDVVCVCCPRLESLEIEGPAFLEHSEKTYGNIPLKRLRFSSFAGPHDETSLMFLMYNCKSFREIFPRKDNDEVISQRNEKLPCESEASVSLYTVSQGIWVLQREMYGSGRHLSVGAGNECGSGRHLSVGRGEWNVEVEGTCRLERGMNVNVEVEGTCRLERGMNVNVEVEGTCRLERGMNVEVEGTCRLERGMNVEVEGTCRLERGMNVEVEEFELKRI